MIESMFFIVRWSIVEIPLKDSRCAEEGKKDKDLRSGNMPKHVETTKNI
jgi:hypothetical protein